MVKLKIEKLVDGGQGIAHENDYTYFIWNALPGEEVEAEIINKRKGIYECLAVNFVKPSPHRIKPNEDHFLSCSAWAMMDIDYENEMKKEAANETYRRIGGISVGAGLAPAKKGQPQGLPLQIETNNVESGYRNKMEFSFVEGVDEKISLAFFKRGQKVRIPIESCELATDAINDTAKKILDWVNSTSLTMRNMKALIVRSNMKGETVAGLFIKDKLTFDNYPMLDKKFIGFNLYYSTHKSPASVITEVLYQKGQDFLIEEIAGKQFKYGINSFFQVNIPVFEMALKDISDSIRENSQNSSNSRIIDFYSGVGAIGLSIGANQLVESNMEAVSFAQENIGLNKIGNCEATLSPAEKALDYIEKDKTIIFDPPRAGLHDKVLDRLIEVTPKKIIYLSCNIATQARDISILKDKYDIKFMKLYNFFPRTPHIEALVVLELTK
ncbi:MAG TPA: methyltransferase [Patescibacteria group bacterium]|nr:methyltransferase [Patescibacteria group bacterium]